MTFDYIKSEIVKRADEMFGVDVYVERAGSHFVQALVHLVDVATQQLTSPLPSPKGEGVFTEQDFSGLVCQEKLVLGVNCVFPCDLTSPLPSPIGEGVIGGSPTGEGVIGLQYRLLRPLGVYHFSHVQCGYRHAHIVVDDRAFGYIINNPLVKNENVMYVSFVGEHVVVFPFRADCYLKYVRKFGVSHKGHQDSHEGHEVDSVFLGDLSDSFSLKLIYSAIELAVVGVRNEVVVQEGV